MSITSNSVHSNYKLPNQRWRIYPEANRQAKQLGELINLSPLLAQVLINRGWENPQDATDFLHPENQQLPLPITEFPDLPISLDLLQDAIHNGGQIAICGDYDADGMTSTALLMRSLAFLGAKVDYAIPSRMSEGYGINERIIKEFAAAGVQLVLTVDNGIAAFKPIALAKELGLKVIVTDHHELPPELPPADAILNPKLLSENSPYRGLAGVGVAYVLAISLAQKMGKNSGLVNPMLELFTLGTIADLAPLIGVNRRWVKRGLRLLPKSEIVGIKALIEVAQVEVAKSSSQAQGNKSLKPSDIGFRLGPRINAVGRLDDPQIVIELLTTDDMSLALTRALQCEHINQQRQSLCEAIEQEAIAWCNDQQINLVKERVLVIVQPGWHHGVIGIVASRLVERYGVPVFIGTYEEEDPSKIRGSARGIPEFNVFEALQSCSDLLIKFGGHRAAGGFSFLAENLVDIRSRLSKFACAYLAPEDIKPLVMIDAQINLDQINPELYQQIQNLQPWGIENTAPVFWTPNLKIVDQRVIGKGHLKLTFMQRNQTGKEHYIKAIAWRWGDYFPLPPRVDVAYELKENNWNGNTSIELEVVGVRLPSGEPQAGEFTYGDQVYVCSRSNLGNRIQLKIKNPQGQILAFELGEKTGLLGINRANAQEIDLSQPFFAGLIQEALNVLN